MSWTNPSGPHFKARKHFTMTLAPDVHQMVTQFMQQEHFDSEIQAVSALIRIGLSSTPTIAMEMSTRYQAYNEVKRWTLNQVIRSLREIEQMLELKK